MGKNKINEKNIIIGEKKNLRDFIDYLVDSYYLNSNNIYNKDDILLELKIKDSRIITAFIDYLVENKYLKYKRNKKFIITFEGFKYLENIQKSNQQYENSLHSIIVAMIALLVNIFGTLINNTIINVILTIATFIIMNYYIGEIFNKKYY